MGHRRLAVAPKGHNLGYVQIVIAQGDIDFIQQNKLNGGGGEGQCLALGQPACAVATSRAILGFPDKPCADRKELAEIGEISLDQPSLTYIPRVLNKLD